jgi:phospholipid transport system substrate-binding protein
MDGQTTMKIIKPMLALLLLVTTAAAAPHGTATDAIKTANTKLRSLLSQKTDDNSEADHKVAQQITHELRDLFDIRDLTQRALVDHWEKMPKDKRDQVVDTMQQIVEKSYLKQLKNNLNYEIVYGGEENKEGDVLVKTTIKAERRGRPAEFPVSYLLHADGDHWKVYDVITDDLSTIETYRSDFNQIIAKNGVDGLISKMKTKLDKGDGK